MEDGRPVSPDFVTMTFPEFLKGAELWRVRFHDLRHYADIGISATPARRFSSPRVAACGS